MEQTSSSTFYAVEVLIHLICAVEADIQNYVLGYRIELDGDQSGIDNQLAGLVARRHEADAGDVLFQVFDSFDEIYNGSPGSYSDEACIWGKVLFDGLDCSRALGFFDVVRHGGRGTGGDGGT